MAQQPDRPREPEPSFGPDEEGEVSIDPLPGCEPHGAWIGTDEARHREEVEQHEDRPKRD